MTNFHYQLMMNLPELNKPDDVIDALALAPFIEGEQPWAKTVRIANLRADASLLPEGYEPERTAASAHLTVSLVRGEDWTLLVRRWAQTALVVVTACDPARGQAVLDEVTEGVSEPPPQDSSVSVGFWYLSALGPVRNPRNVAVEDWAAIRRNYSASVAVALDAVVATRPDSVNGKLLLLHGPPGTGKTTALRAIADAWRSWCSLELVLDPERLFGDAGYLMSLLLGQDDEDEGRWRLLALEDCDELIRGDAKAGAGQALSRLLNLTDGLVGQGLRVLVAITTNEPLARLHPAITRVGRCLAEIEVGPLSADECRRWLGRPAHIPATGMTLAELWAMSSTLGVVRNERSDVAVGQYL